MVVIIVENERSRYFTITKRAIIGAFSGHRENVRYLRFQLAKPLSLDSGLLSDGSSDEEEVESYSGLLTVDPGTNGSLFFWFWPAQEQAATAPLLLWLQGGPGLSSVGLGALKLHGPLVLHVNKEKRQLLGLRRNPHTWAKKQNVIYIDFPVGTGQWILATVDIFFKIHFRIFQQQQDSKTKKCHQ